MAIRAYILIETMVGRTRDVVGGLRALSEVESVETVTGPYDIIVVATALDLNAVGDLVTNRIHIINGIVRTITCLPVDVA